MKKTIIIDQEDLRAFTIVNPEANNFARFIREILDNANYGEEIIVTMETQ